MRSSADDIRRFRVLHYMGSRVMTLPERDPGPAPRRIGRYEILLPIASGGMGTVYLAKSRGVGGFEREVALKVMHPHLREEAEFASDLVEEAKLAGRIKHPNVVPVLDVGEDPHGVFMVMEYVEGDSLAGLWRARKKSDDEVVMPAPVGLRILCDALAGLHAAHELRDEEGVPLGLVHRDFSPQNVLVGADGTSRLTDFGVAKASSRLSSTRTGFVKGKVNYMAPEQAKSEELDRRTDLWAAGVIAWELLAGRRLYRERNEMTVLLQLVSETPPRLRRVRPDLPAEIEAAVARALHPILASRTPTARELADELASTATRIGGVASADEVAAYVAETSGKNLAARREQLRQALVTVMVPIAGAVHTEVTDSAQAVPVVQRTRRGRAWVVGAVATVAVATAVVVPRLRSDDPPAPSPAAAVEERTATEPVATTEPPPPATAAVPSAAPTASATTEPRRAHPFVGARPTPGKPAKLAPSPYDK
jgi:eukaryotic-like serine/threonine-protein kinase